MQKCQESFMDTGKEAVGELTLLQGYLTAPCLIEGQKSMERKQYANESKLSENAIGENLPSTSQTC
ncbi:hypothetical protein APTSU1_000596900 [Apodemus speciosus]|uniref:Uncharacterized protein n=1 Tax=Apodemus speciosus TaxID=105296 RepID=A0ABQ0EUN4_APOSI